MGLNKASEEKTMRRLILTFGLLAYSISTANAQVPQQPSPGVQPGQLGPFDQFGPFTTPNNVMPNIYNPQYQPLSPYLNTVRGTNPAVDYYFLTRPGTVGMGGRGSSGGPFMAQGGNRMVFFPQLASAPEPFQQPGMGSPGSVLPPAGHQVVFSNTLGYFPSAFGQAGARGGLAGLGGQGPKK